MKKRLLWLGGTGRTGYLVIEKALAAGWAVNVLAREPARISAISPDVTVFKGSPEQVAYLDAALAGCDAVIGTMNNAQQYDISDAGKVVETWHEPSWLHYLHHHERVSKAISSCRSRSSRV